MQNKKIVRFIALAFSISWLAALVMYLLDIAYGSILSLVIIALIYMPAPAYATLILQKFVYKGTLAEYGLTFRNISLRWLIITILCILVLVLGTLALIALLGNILEIDLFGRVDFSEAAFLQQVNNFVRGLSNVTIDHLPFPPFTLFLISLVQGVVVGLTVSLPFALGEELGWRGLLSGETRKLGFIRSNLLIGLVWGLWHAPIILMGHNYPGHPISGVFMMTAFTIALSFPMAYCRFQTKSVIGPTVFHGTLNALGGLTPLFVVGANPLFGFVAGVASIVIISLITTGIFICDRKFVHDYKTL